MQYRIREKFWSWGNDFHIYDSAGEPAFFVDGVAFCWGDQLSFQDLHGHELAYIKQRLMSWKPTYEIIRGGKPFANVVKEFSWLSKSFTLDVPGPNDYAISGQFWGHEYEFQRGGKMVAKVSKTLWSLNDTYGVDIVAGEDDVAILCTCIVIDQVLHDETANSG